MRAIGYYRLIDDEQEDLREALEERFEEYCERYVHQSVAIFGDLKGRSLKWERQSQWKRET